ncbi:hypothetical protein DBV15_02769 [Temnothorax longispinosus]|uniref:Uncharacterized protein n=1 Tax=Temnothorax longispinosus TaxID=300112 RepID=A0A4S2KKL0_9HYME|nr:hypothetical protein DBV15_02769 [Temnothorax longispinosus]
MPRRCVLTLAAPSHTVQPRTRRTDIVPQRSPTMEVVGTGFSAIEPRKSRATGVALSGAMGIHLVTEHRVIRQGCLARRAGSLEEPGSPGKAIPDNPDETKEHQRISSARRASERHVGENESISYIVNQHLQYRCYINACANRYNHKKQSRMAATSNHKCAL